MNKIGTVTYVNSTSGLGIFDYIRFTMSLSDGISPSSATLVTTPQATLPPDVGDVTLDYSDLGSSGQTQIVFTNCAINQIRLAQEDGYVWQIQLLDRRWKWQDKGEISGVYNQRFKDGQIDPATEKTPQEIALLLFAAMGEETTPGQPLAVHVTNLPNQSRPTINWDRVNPARELADLCESLGCVISPQVDGSFKIHQLGNGDTLSDVGAMRLGAGLLYGTVPEKVKIVGAETEFQSRLQLEAVGLDSDGEIKPLADLSYTPLAANIVTDPWGFENIAGEEDQRLAIRSVFRWYRVIEFQFFPLPGGQVINNTRQLRLKPGKIAETTFYGVKKEREKPGIIGTFWDEDAKGDNQAGHFNGSVAVDTNKAIIRFSQPMFKKSAAGLPEAADIYVEIAYSAVDDNLIPIRFERERAVPVSTESTPTRIVKHDEIQRTIKVNYDQSIPGAQISEDDTETLAEAAADHYLDHETTKYDIQNSKGNVYDGLVPISLDGLTRSVTYSLGGGTTRTAASADRRENPFVMSFDEKRRLERNDFIREESERVGVRLERFLEDVLGVIET